MECVGDTDLMDCLLTPIRPSFSINNVNVKQRYRHQYGKRTGENSTPIFGGPRAHPRRAPPKGPDSFPLTYKIFET